MAGRGRLTSFSIGNKQGNHTKVPGEGHLGSWRPLRVLPLTPTHRRLCLKWCYSRENWTTSEWSQVIFSDESRFDLSSDGNRVRVSRLLEECLNPVFALQ
ncbi:transposable element Tcb1 transposase [Trichonephila clavipes]|nr:transposable element Tcb1 transposase [Trichonephila clavipes]